MKIQYIITASISIEEDSYPSDMTEADIIQTEKEAMLSGDLPLFDFEDIKVEVSIIKP